MKLRGGVSCLVCAAVALTMLALAATASAAAVSHNGVRFALLLSGTHGYEVEISTRGHRQVTLTASKDDSVAVYTTLGRVNRNGIDADFGALGRVSARFSAPRRHRRVSARPATRCHGREPQFDVGRLHGTLRFDGEEGFTDVAAHRAVAVRELSFRRVCRGRPASASAAGTARRSVALTLLAAIDTSTERHVSFAALGIEANGPKPSEFESEPGLFVVANANEHREGVAIERGIFLIGANGGILLSKLGVEPISATVAMPRPFEGTASFLENPGSPPSWTGDLTISLPGARNIPLTGSSFQPLFCRAASERVFDRCAKPFEDARRPARIAAVLGRAGGPAATQLSGSRSRSLWDTGLSLLR